MRSLAIVLAAGRGSRMESDIPKQYMKILDKPMLYYSLKAFELSSIDDVYVVVADGEEEYCRENIIETYNIKKCKTVLRGGHERYDSVYNAISVVDGYDVVLIHDGARPMIGVDIIEAAISGGLKYRAYTPAVNVKDTIKLLDKDGHVNDGLDRKSLYAIQTPQSFDFNLCKSSYEKAMQDRELLCGITDDAMLISRVSGVSSHLGRGNYRNIKVTTPEDVVVAEAYLSMQAW